MAPNPSRALHKISEIYDRIAFAAVGRYNEYENLRKAGVTYADVTGYQFDRRDVTARGIANWYAQQLSARSSPRSQQAVSRLRSSSPRRQKAPADDQIYRITFDGSVADEHGFAAIGGQADQVSTVLKERYSDGMSLIEALSAALAALAAPTTVSRLTCPAASSRWPCSTAAARTAPGRLVRRPPGAAAAGKPPGPIRRFGPGHH